MKDWKNKGWVKLYRQIEDNPFWLLEPFTKAQAWIDLFLNANHKDGVINIRGNIITIKRGQIGWSELTMAKRWKWSKGKVRRFLKVLETEQQIEQQKDRYLTTIITILKYEDYQNDKNDTADSTADGQQTVHKQECKNVKNEKNYISEPSSQVNKVMDEFYEINPTLNYGNITQRRAVDDMIKRWGEDNLVAMVRKYKENINERFMPVATTPLAFKNKVGDIKVAIDKLENNQLITSV